MQFLARRVSFVECIQLRLHYFDLKFKTKHVPEKHTNAQFNTEDNILHLYIEIKTWIFSKIKSIEINILCIFKFRT